MAERINFVVNADDHDETLDFSLDRVKAIQNAAIDAAEKSGANLLELAYASETMMNVTVARLEYKAMRTQLLEDTDDDERA